MKSVNSATKVLVRAPTPVRKPQTKRMQGEGDHHAARRHRASVESFVKSGRVEDAARDAEPGTPVEEVEMFNAERIGEARSKGEDPASCA
jgi:hypothetical protein